MKPHIYRVGGSWFCRLDLPGVRLLGFPAPTPARAYNVARTYWMANWRVR